jgi:ectoine hydroxylase-related dioxygenase (phytanoyl-CoA dioxygenase family)
MLSREQRSFYEDNGYAVVRGLLSRQEAGVFRAEAHSLIDRLSRAQTNVEATWDIARAMVGVVTKTQPFHRHNVEFFSVAFTKLIVDDRLTSVAANVLKTPNVQLHQTKLFIKAPEKGSPFPMHQDHPYFPHRDHSMIAANLHFDDAPEEKGCLRVVPGSHKLGPLEHRSAGNWHLPFETYPLEWAVSLPAKAGDAVFFSYLTVHGSGVNVSDETRTTLLVQMRDAADQPLDEVGGEPGQELMLCGTADM